LILNLIKGKEGKKCCRLKEECGAEKIKNHLWKNPLQWFFQQAPLLCEVFVAVHSEFGSIKLIPVAISPTILKSTFLNTLYAMVAQFKNL